MTIKLPAAHRGRVDLNAYAFYRWALVLHDGADSQEGFDIYLVRGHLVYDRLHDARSALAARISGEIIHWLYPGA